MELLVSQEDFMDGLRLVSRARSTKNTIPILSGVRLEARDSWLELQCTDLELGIRTRLPADVRVGGSVVLPVRYLVELVRRLSPGFIAIRVDLKSSITTLANDDADYVLHGFPAEQFPGSAEEKERHEQPICLRSLQRLLRETSFAISHDESRPWLSGVLLSLEGEAMTATATNGAVVAMSSVSTGHVSDAFFSVIVPGRSVQEIVHVVDEASAEDGSLTVSQQRMELRVGDMAISTRLLEGQYPDVGRVLPSSYQSTLTVDRARLLEACQRAALLAHQNEMVVQGEVNGLVVHARTPEVGIVTERVAAALHGDPFRVALNPQYVIDGLRRLDSQAVILEFTGKLRPVRIRPHNEAASCFVVMPLVTA